MNNINSVTIGGRLVRDPEIRVTASGTPVLNFSVCCNQSKKGYDGNWEEVPNFFDFKMFGPRAESIAKILSKGTKVVVNGKAMQNTWEKDGQKKHSIDFLVNEIEILSQTQKTPNPPQNDYYADEDIPF